MSDEFKDGDQALPQYNPDAVKTLAGFMDTMFTLHDIKQEHCLPAKVVSYNRNANKATVSPIVKYAVDTQSGKKYIDRQEYKDIYVLGFGSTRYSITAPLVEGDLGILIACDRSWSAAKDANSSENPSENEGAVPSDDDLVSSFEHGIFIPCSFADCNIPEEYKKALVIKALSESGNNRKVVIDADDLKKTDAKFREAIVLSKEINTETGKSRFIYRKHRILADEGEDADNNSDLGGIGGSSNAYFSIYAPEDREGYSIRAGRVCVDNDQFLDVDETKDVLDPEKEYFCCVKIVRDSGLIAGAEIVAFDKIDEEDAEKRLEAERKQFEEYAPEDFDTCKRWIIPIGSIDDDGNITQRHIGAINLSSDAQERPDFKIYVSGYDTAAKTYTYDIAAGTVQANGKTATATAVAGISLNTDYWCKVTYEVSDQTLEAEITSTEPTYPDDDATVVWKVKIGKATATEIQQLHIGTLSLALPNHSLKVNGTEQAKFFGTKDIDISLSDSDTINFSSFSCRRTQIGGTQCEFFLPSGSAYVNGNAVDFSQNFTTTTGDWKTPNGITTSGTIYCWIGTSSYASNATHYAHFSTSAKSVGTKDGNENVEACFKVCEIGNAGNQTVIDGISQIASGTMCFTMHDDFAFKVEKVGGNWEIYLPDDAVVRLHKSETASDNGRVLITALTRDANMQAAASGRVGWYTLPNGVASGTSIYAEFDQDKESGEDGQYKRNFLSYKIVTVPTSGKEKIKVAQVVGGELNEVTQIVNSTIVLKEDSKSVTSITGDAESSEKIDGDIEITGKLSDGTTSCGIEFTTVSARSASGDDPARPARIIANIKNRNGDEENWGAHTLTYKNAEGGVEYVHFLGCTDVDITDSTGGGSGSHNIANVIGSDYIKVADKTEEEVTKREVKAKIATADPKGNQEHALLTHDTDQIVRCKKIFTNANGTVLTNGHIDIDGPNAKVAVVAADQQRKIELDANSIPAICKNKVIGVHELKFKDKNKNTLRYHGMFCDDIDMTSLLPEGKLISNVSLSPSSASGGFNTIVFTYTDGSSTTVTIQNGIDGTSGLQGEPGETPEIEVGDITPEGVLPKQQAIYVNGEQVAVITDGRSPVITMGEGSGSPKEYPVMADGVVIGRVHDGANGTITDPVTEQEFITDISFSESNGIITANVTKKKGKIISLADVGTAQKTVITGTEISIVSGSTYNGEGAPNSFVNTKKKIHIIGSAADGDPESVFTTTPLSSENQ